MVVTVTTNVGMEWKMYVTFFSGLKVTLQRNFSPLLWMLQATPPPSGDQIHSFPPSRVIQEDVLKCSKTVVNDMNHSVGSHSKPQMWSLLLKTQIKPA